MKKTNFLKAFAMAAVVLFATSCSEESLSIQSGDITENPTVLPNPTASISVTVVDLEAGKIIGGVSTVDATSAIGGKMTVECPANEGYTTAAAVEVAIPSLSKGQSINIPVTFYVVTLQSAYNNLQINWESTSFDTVVEEEVSMSDINIEKQNGWVNGVYENNSEDAVKATYTYWELSGYEFAEEVVESKAAETSYEEILKANLKFKKFENNRIFDVPAWNTFTIKSAKRTFVNQTWVVKNDEGEVVYRFLIKACWGTTFETELVDNTPSHDGHDNSHNGHNGHGHGNNNNAGGGNTSNSGI